MAIAITTTTTNSNAGCASCPSVVCFFRFAYTGELLMDPYDKIQPAVHHPGALQSIEPARKVKPQTSNRVEATTGDRVDLSDRAKQLLIAQKQIRSMSDMDMEKVAKIKAQIKAGTYQVDAQKTAAKMLQETFIGQQK
jgi:flagellar biosynthesis anti-sigma factor FlgM